MINFTVGPVQSAECVWFFGPFDGERCMGYGGCIDV